ncbi:hypothetical protein AKO1_010563, partial [Acrasis kona]
MLIWMLKEGVSKEQTKNFLNKIINAFTALISFLYLFIIQQASQIFVCTNQADQSWTLNASPDITCFVSDGQWSQMLPLSIIIYLVFGLGYVLLFVVLFLRSRYLLNQDAKIRSQIQKLESTEDGAEILILEGKLENVRLSIKNFKMQFKFLLTRFKTKYIYWELIITARKLGIAVLNTFLPSVLVLVFGLVIMFLSLLLHIHTVPFRKKFHNLMEYIVLICIVLTLFFGLLFFVDQFPAEGFKTFCTFLAISVLVVGTVAVVCMSVIDFFIRRRKENQLEKSRREEIRAKFGDLKDKELEAEYRKFFPSMFDNIDKSQEEEEWLVEVNPLFEAQDEEDEDEWVLTVNPLSESALKDNDYMDLDEEKEIKFTPPFYSSEVESDNEAENADQTLNQIISDVFSVKRAHKNIKAAKSSGKKILELLRSYAKTVVI